MTYLLIQSEEINQHKELKTEYFSNHNIFYFEKLDTNFQHSIHDTISSYQLHFPSDSNESLKR